MNILMLTQYYPPEVGATQTRMHYFAQSLAHRGHQVTVITEIPNHPKGVVFDGYRRRILVRRLEDGCEVFRVWVYASPRKSAVRRFLFYGSYMAQASIVGLVLRKRFDVILATSPPLPVGGAALVLSKAKRCPFVLDVRDLWPAVGVTLGEIRGSTIIRAAEWLEGLLYRQASAVTCVTKGFIGQIVGKGARAESVHFVPNGTIPDLFNPHRADETLRRRLGLEGKFIVAFCGNHGVAQGLENVLAAAALLREQQNLEFLFIGEGPVKAGLVALQRRQDVKNVRFLPEVPLTKVASYINAADIMLVPLRASPIFSNFIPSKLFDFMACGRPVILTVDGEARQILEAAGGGVYVEPDNPEALAEMIVSLRAQPDSLAQMGRKGRTYVLANYTRAQQVEHLEEILTGVAARVAPRRSGPRRQ